MKIIFHRKVHTLLWGHNIEYDDSPSLCNIMCNGNMKSGVLIDYDFSLASLRHPCHMPQARTNRMGGIPFMAIGLLKDEYWNGSIERLYRHDLEAFIWILPFVFLRYQNGKSQRGTLVDQWMTSNYIACRKEKISFQNVWDLPNKKLFCQSDFKDHWKLVQSLLVWQVKISLAALERMHELGMTSDSSVASIWPLFVERLRLVAKRDPEHLSYVDKLVNNLGLENIFLT